ncbi:hypothetical protein [Phenylobacterium sp.]|jgi:hypothetical protein|uniref:hypothetical protein n=1 Tax=Phenylobacterium sp. TaxID=1871053 RepID=UPI002F91C9E2
MSWIFRGLAALLLVAAAANAWQARPAGLQPGSEIARRLTSTFPASAAPQVVLASEPIYELRVEGCPEPLRVAVVPPSFTPRAALLNLAAPGGRTIYAYSDWVGERPDRRAVFMRRLWRPLLASIGLSDDSRMREMLVIAEPPGCNVAATASWSNYWRGRRPS